MAKKKTVKENSKKTIEAVFRKDVLLNSGLDYNTLCSLIAQENDKRLNSIDRKQLKKDLEGKRGDLKKNKEVTEEEIDKTIKALEIPIPSRMSYNKWGVDKDQRFPHIDILVLIARETKTNVASLLSLTDITTADDVYKINFDLRKLRWAEGLQKGEFAEKLSTTTDVLSRYEVSGLRQYRLDMLLRFCEALNCSMDYLLGLTSYRQWGNDAPENNFLAGIKGGSAMYIKTQDGSIDSNCLLSTDRKNFYFPNGDIKRIADEVFEGAFTKVYE